MEIDDVWILPNDLEATTLGLACERNFYARCPPSKRPLHLRGPRPSSTSLPTPTADDDDPDSKDDKDDVELGKVDPPSAQIIGSARPISASEDKGKLGTLKKSNKKGEDGKDEDKPKSLPNAEEGGKVYNQSLLRSINQVVFWRSVHQLLASPGVYLRLNPPELVSSRVVPLLDTSIPLHSSLFPRQVLVRRSTRPPRLHVQHRLPAGDQQAARVHPGLVRLRARDLGRCPPAHRTRHRTRVWPVGDESNWNIADHAFLQSVDGLRVSLTSLVR